MPRYFFNIHDGIDLPDSEGTELPNLAKAQQEAVRFAGTTIADRAKSAKLGADWTMQVTDDSGLVLFRLDFFVSATSATLGLLMKKEA